MPEPLTISLYVVFPALIFVAILYFERVRRQKFEARWPTLTDDEFMAACPPGTSRDIALRVRKIVSEQLGVPYDRVHPDQRFVDVLDGC